MRLIDADALLKTHCNECTLYPNDCLGDDCDNGAVIHIKEAPTVDAVPVIRCKDCKHRPYRDGDGMIDGDYVCPYLCDDPFYSVMPREDWFCHRAERRHDGSNSSNTGRSK